MHDGKTERFKIKHLWQGNLTGQGLAYSSTFPCRLKLLNAQFVIWGRLRWNGADTASLCKCVKEHLLSPTAKATQEV